ncbi:MAG: pilus assembly protein TadG-related protein [Isosphaeraceae bacterium]
MRLVRNRFRRPSKGTVIVLAAALMPALIGFAALSVDTAVLTTAKAQLQTAADAAALAGAMELVSDRRLKNMPPVTDLSTEITAAQTRAVSIAQTKANWALNQQVDAHSGDIAAGNMNLNNQSGQYNPFAPIGLAGFDMSKLNSLQVSLYRDDAHGGKVPSFFGFGSRQLTVTSVATIQPYTITGYRSVNSQNVNLLPIVLNVSNYNDMIAGRTTDQYSYNSASGVTQGPDGVPESLLYPVRSGNPGNWGTIKVGVSNNSTSTLGAQIRYGITPAQIATFPGGKISLDQKDTSTNPPTSYHNFGGNPGISAGIKDDLAAIIGKPVTIPIYDQSGGNGNNAWFRVIAFAGVRIVYVNFQGNPKYVIVQTALLSDPSIIADQGSPLPFTSGGAIRLQLTK